MFYDLFTKQRRHRQPAYAAAAKAAIEWLEERRYFSVPNPADPPVPELGLGQSQLVENGKNHTETAPGAEAATSTLGAAIERSRGAVPWMLAALHPTPSTTARSIAATATSGVTDADVAAADEVWEQRLVQYAQVNENFYLNKKITGTDGNVGTWQRHAEQLFQEDPALLYFKTYDVTGDSHYLTVARKMGDRLIHEVIRNPLLNAPGNDPPEADRVHAKYLFTAGLVRDFQTADAERRQVIQQAFRDLVQTNIGQFIRPSRGLIETAGYRLDGASTRDTVRINAQVMDLYLDYLKVKNTDDPLPYFLVNGQKVDGMTAILNQLFSHFDDFIEGVYHSPQGDGSLADAGVDPPYWWFARASEPMLRVMTEWPGGESYRVGIETRIADAARRIRDEAWVVGDKAFKYSKEKINDDGNGSMVANPGLNIKFSKFFAEAARISGDASYRALAREAYVSGADDADLERSFYSETPGPSLTNITENAGKRWTQYGRVKPNLAELIDIQSGGIQGSVFNDLNGNRDRSTNEPGLAGRAVYLDLNNSRARDTNEPQTLTNATGDFTFNGVAAGQYVVRQVLPAGWRQTMPSTDTGRTITVDSGQTVQSVLFGASDKAAVRGTVFRDGNGNGLRDAGEGALSGWRIFLDADNDGQYDSGERNAITDAWGYYAFEDLVPGSYAVRTTGVSGYTISRPASASYMLDLSAGQVAGNRDFAAKPIV